MPTKRFLKLKEEKKHAILEAAVHEFSRVPYSLASINQIIKEADISRGSFYTYFEDKDDLMRFILQGFRDNFQNRIYHLLEQEGGDPFAVSVKLLEAVMEDSESGLSYKMYKNMLSDLSVVNQNHLFGIKGFLFQDDAYMEFVREFYRHIDKKRYSIDEETMAYLVEMTMLIVVKALALYYKNVADRKQILEIVEKEMSILKNGACQRS